VDELTENYFVRSHSVRLVRYLAFDPVFPERIGINRSFHEELRPENAEPPVAKAPRFVGDRLGDMKPGDRRLGN
jgi:hypothetical protein